MRICRDRASGGLVAVKKLKKAEMVRRGQVDHVRAERNVLAEVRHRAVVRLLCSFQDEEMLYLVMEYMPGGDLMTLLIRQEILPEPMARFYLAQVDGFLRWCWEGVERVAWLVGTQGRAQRTEGHTKRAAVHAMLPLRLCMGGPNHSTQAHRPTCPAADGGGPGGHPCRGLHPSRHQAG